MSTYIGSLALFFAVLAQIVLFVTRNNIEHGRKLALHACCGLYLIAAAICFK